ncbi:hypothetical protein AU192_21080 [Mycobacterium lehmannii]|uniref:Uncharacterized protein n=1 Tax=Mycobacterium lehmannii TaxID=2048550 RepID=A0A117JK85_9MYCO|nr:DUF6308 family protein [Mycobacterium lehmannii]KUI17010.1 hypothetical protein AU192_21080 [Mycobacterium lehmannii]
MTERPDYSDWRQSWPALVVSCDTDAALKVLHDYYAVDDEQLPLYTGSRFEAIARMNADPYALKAEDFVAVSMLSVTVPAKAAIRLLGRDAEIIHRLLRQIPDDLDIIDANPELLDSDSRASQLWQILRRGRDGLGPTTTSKLLAAKRPRLLPIWGTFVQQATGMDTVGYWWKFRFVLSEDQLRLWDWLGELRSRSASVPGSVSELRILDVLLWMSVRSGGGKRAEEPV